MKRVFEVDPLVCPKCSAQMKIIAFITLRLRSGQADPKELSSISKSLGIKPFEKPKKVRVAPTTQDSAYESIADDILPD